MNTTGKVITQPFPDIIFSIVLLITPMFCFAQSAEEYFNIGLEAFQAGEYEKAKTAFYSAEAAGLDNARLYFNLGVSHYKLNEYQLAYDAFQKSLSLPVLQFLAYFNSGLCAIKLNDKELAKTQWLAARDKANTTAELNQVQKKLAQIGVTWVPGLRLRNTLSFGYSDNVSFSSDDIIDSSDRKDNYVSLLGAAELTLMGNIHSTVSYQIYDYRKLHDYDYQSYKLDLAYSEQSQPIAYQLKLAVKRDYLDDSALMDWYIANLGASYGSARLKPYINYQTAKINPQKRRYQYLQGKSHNMEVGVRGAFSAQPWKISYQREKNHQTEVLNLYTSPTRQKLFVSYAAKIGMSNNLKTSFSYRHSEFDASVILPKREDRQKKLEINYFYRLKQKTAVVLSYQQLKNSSTENSYSYKTNYISVGIVVF